MTREEWVKVKGEPYIPLGVWFSYYRENGGWIDDPIEFEAKFNEIIKYHPVFYSEMHNTLMHISIETAKSRLFNYYDLMYGL